MSLLIRLTVAADNRLVIAGLLALAFTVTACAPSRVPAPVESRKVSKSAPAPTRSASVASDQSSVPLPAAPDGFYRVRRGDTLIGISLDHGAAWRDIMGRNFPAMAVIGVSALVEPAAMIEIEATAVVPE